MKNDKREKILDAMEQLMCSVPDKDISVSMIAKKAEIAKGSIYYYFNSRDDILDAVVERCYKKGLHEYFKEIKNGSCALDKIKLLFYSMIKQEFHDNQKNLLHSLHLHESPLLHTKLKLVAVEEVSPVLEELLLEGKKEGSIQTDTPKESAEMIVAVITYFLDSSIFTSNINRIRTKLKIFAGVLDCSLHAKPGSFDFLWNLEKII